MSGSYIAHVCNICHRRFYAGYQGEYPCPYCEISHLKQVNEELRIALNNATENRWGAWEIERAEVKGDNLAKEFRIIDLEAENAKLRERLTRIG